MNRFFKNLCTVLIAFILVLASVNAVSASTDAEYEDYIKSFARKDTYVVDDTIFVDYYINDSGEIDDVVRLTYVKGVPTYLVEIINNEIVQTDLISETQERFSLPSTSGNVEINEPNVSTRSASDGFEYLNKVIYGTASIGDKVIGVWSKMISSNRNVNYDEPRPNGMLLGIIAAAMTGAVGFVISATLVGAIISSVGGFISGGVVNGISNGLKATGTVITYHMKVTESGDPRERIFTDGMYFGGNVNGKYITQYTGMYPQFAAFKDGAVADAVYNYFWDGIHHVKSWN